MPMIGHRAFCHAHKQSSDPDGVTFPPRMTDQDDLSGRKIGEFVLRERIGEGAFGAVYCCEQPLLGRDVVVKVLQRRLWGSVVVVQRFLREAQLASRLDHPYATHIYAFGIEPLDPLTFVAVAIGFTAVAAAASYLPARRATRVEPVVALRSE